MFDSLPGFPDGISRAADGKTYWLSIVNPPNLLSALLKYRYVRSSLRATMHSAGIEASCKAALAISTCLAQLAEPVHVQSAEVSTCTLLLCICRSSCR